jgi:hypothetical protein
VKNLSVVPPALSEDPFRGALEVARSETFSPQEWDAYQRAKMAEQDARGALAVARQEGAEEGRKLALAKLRAREDHQEILMRVLARKALVLTQEQRDQIATCTDLATLDRWFDNALAARAVADVFSVMRSA